MPSNLTKRKYKQKRRSCPLCKPHKTHHDDQRGLAERRADVALQQALTDNDWEFCPKCRGRFSFRKPVNGKCCWCGHVLASGS